MTLSLTDVLLAVIAVCAVIAAISLLRSTGRIADSASEVERAVQTLSPRVDRLLQEGSDLIAQSRSVLERLEAVADDASAVSTEAKRVAVPMIHDLSIVREVTHQLAAVMKGLQAGVSALGRHR
jgi:hypothetical protein